MSNIVVMKFGGTSVADADCIRRAARRAIQRKQDGQDVVMVVSAMGKTTDELVVRLPDETLNIRADNEDSFQGPVAQLNSPGD